MLRYVFLCFVALSSVSAGFELSDEERKAMNDIIFPIMQKCKDITKINEQPVLLGNPKLVTCALKETEIIDAKGMFDKDAAIIILKKAVKNEAFIEKANKIGDACLKVNELDVTDGEEGVERAAYLIKCIKDHADEIME